MSESEEDLVSKQQIVLETFFTFIGRFSFDKAKEFIDKERDGANKNHQGTPFFSTVLMAFSQLAVAEKNYSTLIFLGPKGFLRKDSSLKSMYESLKNEFQRLEDKRLITPIPTPAMSPTLSCRTPSPPNSAPSPSPSASTHSEVSTSTLSSLSVGSMILGNFLHSSPTYQGAENLENLASHLCGQLLHFVCARLETMEFYERMCVMSSWRFMAFDQLLITITEIVKKYQKHFHHPLLIPLKSSFSSECEILLKLLEAQVHLQNWKFLPSLLCLQEAHSKLGAWTSVPREGKRGSLTSSTVRLPSAPPLYHWLCSLKAALVSKFTLYFHEALSKQTSVQEMKTTCSKTSVDYFQKILSFQKRNDAVCVAIVLDTNGLEDYRGHGYSYPDKYYEAPKGLDSLPAIICCPPEKPMVHWPSVVMIMNNKDIELRNSENVVSFYDSRVNSTYFMYKVESRMTLVIIFDNKKSERDTHIPRFMQALCSQLRCNKVFASLKPGAK